jgi:hypothetical protein
LRNAFRIALIAQILSRARLLRYHSLEDGTAPRG